MRWSSALIVVGALAGCAGTEGNREEAQKRLKAGYLLREREDFGGAARAFAAAINQDPSFGQAHMELGIEYLRYGLRLEDAAKEFARAAALDPSLWMASQYRVLALYGLGDKKGALAAQKALVQREPGRAEVHNNYGDLLLKERRWEDAARCFRKALELKSPYPLARGGLGIALWQGGNVEEGIEHLRAAAADLPRRVSLRLELARALLAHNRPAEAAAEAEAAREVEPDNGLVYHILAEVRLAQGDRDAAAAMAREARVRRCELSAELRAKLDAGASPEAGNQGGSP
ncbi:MAG TPA: hypothetical protein DCM87_13425 [Planctomycetes bacterium]|nr:hypothetical protein [Planctomycetota bacterium]